ncbi:hypothetical protein AX16_007302 [Volvariella volvacea WC 439]|nr:hypothetical protein AX16_007302 [Volvariella volvacea WC 439]
MSAAESEQAKSDGPLLLPGPSSDQPPSGSGTSTGNGGTTQLEVGGASITLDELGPMVVNSDGTLSRIANWGEMTDIEKRRTLRVLVARNQIRLRNEEQKQNSNPSAPDASGERSSALSS